MRPISKKTLFVVVCINSATGRNWQTKLFDNMIMIALKAAI